MGVSVDILSASFTFGSSALDESSLAKPLSTYLFGYPIAHSLAPILHGTIWANLAAPWTYNLIESMDQQDLVDKIRLPDFIGSAVTMPHKLTVMKILDGLLDDAQTMGAINTIFVRLDKDGNRRLIGANTDCIGIYEAMVRSCPDAIPDSQSRPALVVGGGGACRSAIYALWKFLGVQEICLANRDRQEVETVISSLTSAGLGAKLSHIESLEQAKACPDMLTIIGTIPDIPAKTDSEIEVQNIIQEFLRRPNKGYLLDMCYFPNPTTNLIQAGVRMGWKTILGTEPLIYQAAYQDVLWLEKPITELAVDEAGRKMREKIASGH